MNSEACAHLSFLLSPKIGPKRFLDLLKHFGTAEKAWTASDKEFNTAGIVGKTLKGFLEFRESFDVKEYEHQLQQKHVTFVPQNSEFYPKSLLRLPNPPIGLFCRGNRELLCTSAPLNRCTFSIAVVGTRKTTSYGRQVTENLVNELVAAGFTIVSGLALGIDAIAHKTAVEQNGTTIAVLGCGVDCPNPQENTRLYSQILENNGIIISEYPLSEPPKPGTFPARNRIIAALSQATLVTEAASDSGSLITADWAQKLGKKVFAVPGPITSRQSDGTAYLLKRNAKFVTSALDILDELKLKPEPKLTHKKDFSHLNLTQEELKIVKLLEDEALSIDQLSKKTNIPVYSTLSLLSALELRGIVKNMGNKIFGITD